VAGDRGRRAPRHERRLDQQRAAASARDPCHGGHRGSRRADAETLALLERYVDAFEAYDIDRLTELLHEDAVQSMPPISLWLKGRDDIFTWWLGPGIGCKGSKLVPVGLVNGMPAWAQYKPAPEGGYEPWSVIVPEVSDGRIVELTFFLDTKTLLALFGLAERLN